MRIGIANVETYEAEYPILYLWRREEADSGGAGTFRGGNGVSLAYVAHGTDRIDTKIVHGIGVEQPMSSGISGGYPGAPNRATLKRRTNIKAKFAGGVVPQSLDELTGEVEFLPPIVRTSQDSEDVYMSMSVGGGGFGDPLLREPARVLADVRSGAVTSAYAGLAYGVVIVESNGEPAVDAAATVRARDDIRQARRSAASQP